MKDYRQEEEIVKDYTASTTDLNGINVTRSDDKAPKQYPDRPWF